MAMALAMALAMAMAKLGPCPKTFHQHVVFSVP